MSKFALSVTLLLVCIISSSNCQLIKENWFTFPIKNQSNPKTQYVINKAIEQLSQNGVFHLKKILSPRGINSLKNEMKDILKINGLSAATHKSRKISTNIFSDSGDDSYSSKHPRNKKLHYRLSGIPRYQLTPQFIELYEYQPLISFFKTIVTSTSHQLPLCDPWEFDCKQWKNLYIGTTKETSSVYIGILKPGDSGGYHLDDEGFRCAFIIDEAEYGGDFMYQWIAPKPEQPPMDDKRNKDKKQARGRGFDWDWKLIKKIINEDTEVKSFRPKSGDLHCFKGNITLHRVEFVDGDNIRTAIAMSYYEENPALTGDVKEMIHIEL